MYEYSNIVIRAIEITSVSNSLKVKKSQLGVWLINTSDIQ
jgi:hypothetical protein